MVPESEEKAQAKRIYGTRLLRVRNGKRMIRKTGLFLFLIYLAFLIYFLFFAESYARMPDRHPHYGFNLQPFREIGRFWNARDRLPWKVVFLNLFGNVIGFLPFGFFLPVISRKWKNVFLVTLLGAAASLLIETVQLVTGTGTFDIDDILLNTLGAAGGCLLFLMCDALRTRLIREI